MKICVTPTGLHSRAMVRVANALMKYGPAEVSFVGRPVNADVQVLHVIGPGVLQLDWPREYAVIQYCYQTAGGNLKQWQEFWSKARCVWSYYDLDVIGTPFYHAPLGVDGMTFQLLNLHRTAVMTSGYVSGPDAEPIEDVGCAAESLGLPIVHLGPPHIEGMKQYPKGFQSYFDIPDTELSTLYNQTLWVSGMRYVEGFEMPVIEGLACGARPICFDRKDMRQWYNGHAVFVPEVHGKELQGILREVMRSSPQPVTNVEREGVLDQFSWPKIAHGFWQQMNV
jgi:hypothetical protein